MTDAQIRACVASMLDCADEDVQDISFLEGGYSNANYAFRLGDDRFVIRLPQREQPFVDRKFEASWYARLPDEFAKPIAFDQASGRMISHWVAGELLVDFWPRQRDAGALVDYLKTLHEALPRCERDYDLPQLLRDYGMPQDGLEIDTRATCHNDLNPWNIIVTDRGWVTLDWEFVGNNEPLFDLVSLHQGLGLPRELLDELATGYLGHDAGEALPHALRAFWLREAGWAKYQIASGNRRSEVREQWEHAQRELAAM